MNCNLGSAGGTHEVLGAKFNLLLSSVQKSVQNWIWLCPQQSCKIIRKQRYHKKAIYPNKVMISKVFSLSNTFFFFLDICKLVWKCHLLEETSSIFRCCSISPTKSLSFVTSRNIFFLKRYSFLSWEIKSYCQFLPNPLSCFNEESHVSSTG